ncbi:MAG: sigma 54-interacting transcriptional regulator [Deltaproteobacteria bacterium]|jgi:Nif-specific regulatory protein|nr:sigma 54-interacting transcriptional regulator [Deltaproteobacteria bacterium]
MTVLSERKLPQISLAESDVLERASELRLLFEVSQALNDASTDLSDHLDQTLDLMARYTGMMRGAFYLANQDGDVVLEAAYGLNQADKKRGRYKSGEGVIGRVVATGRAMVVPNVSQEPLFLNRAGARDLKKEVIAFICVPIILDGKTIGAISADRLFADTVRTEEDMRLLTVLSTLIARAVAVRRDFAARHEAMLAENRRLQAILNQKFKLGQLVGHSNTFRNSLEEVAQVAATNVTVLIRGESGTGKEMIASLIHANSQRAGQAFIKVNCAALPEGLVESELFGHEKGAFTGAVAGRKGRFEMAHGGTLFLDEVGDMSLATQAKLLRVIQEKEFERVGGGETLKVDARILAATNRDLEKMAEEGLFRKDLYYRLSVFPVSLPPLRHRREDILELAETFAQKFKLSPQGAARLSGEAAKALLAYDWPGNIRELENVIERAVILLGPLGGEIEARHLPAWLNPSPGARGPDTLQEAVAHLEKMMISEALADTGGRVTQAAEKLGLSERKMSLRMTRYKIDFHDFRGKK